MLSEYFFFTLLLTVQGHEKICTVNLVDFTKVYDEETKGWVNFFEQEIRIFTVSKKKSDKKENIEKIKRNP